MRCFGVILSLGLSILLGETLGDSNTPAGTLQFRSPPLPSQVQLIFPPHKVPEYQTVPPEQILEVSLKNTRENSSLTPQLPPLAGEYEWSSNRLIFTPLFPFQAGRVYEAVGYLNPGNPSGPRLTQILAMPEEQRTPSTQVLQVYPTSRHIPENLLKFYLEFSAPMQSGRIYQYIHLMDQNGNEVELPFLEIDEELWNPNQTRLTLFIDPGRIKREVRPLEEIGPSLEEGKTFVLKIDSEWKDAHGLPLAKPFIKEFEVISPDRTPIEPENWKLHLPSANSLSPLVIDFLEPLDYALTTRVIQVLQDSGEPLEGKITLDPGESHWRFTPDQAWKSGTYIISILNILEDLAGNNIGKPFEVDLFGTVQRRITTPSSRIPFTLSNSSPSP